MYLIPFSLAFRQSAAKKLTRKFSLVYLFTSCMAMGGSSIGDIVWAGNTTADTRLITDTPPVDNTPNPFTAEQKKIYSSLLMAELAAKREYPEEALLNFLQVAKATQNPEVAKQATQWSIRFQSAEFASQFAEIWAKSAPNDLQAQMVAATLLIGQSINRALPYLSQAIELNPDELDQNIIEIQSRLSERSAEHLKIALQKIAAEKKRNAYAQLMAALSSAHQGDILNANKFVDQSLALNSGLTSAIQLKARLIRHNDKNDVGALKFLKEKVEQFPDNHALRLFLASALLDANQKKDALVQLNKLTKTKEYGGQAWLLLGEIYFKENNFAASKNALDKALGFENTQDNATYLLGELSEKQQNLEQALDFYSKINVGPFHVPATLRSVSILKQQQNYEKALHLLRESQAEGLEAQKQVVLAEIDLLMASQQFEDALNLATEVVEKLPQDIDLLYSYSIVSIQMEKWAQAETSLNKLIKLRPTHSDALNALGYVLAHQTNRFAEARGYVQQALKISPNNPLYLDSLGWIYYREGNYEMAVNYLKAAHQLSNDPEIAAHLGEVLWVAGREEEAKRIWAQAQKDNQNNPKLAATLKKFDANK